VTYNPRTSRNLESELASYLGQSGKALFITGPTKCGKTVLVERALGRSNSVWIQGSDLKSIDVFWTSIVDALALYDSAELATTEQQTDGSAVRGGIRAPVVEFGGQLTESSTSTSSRKYSRSRSHADLAREALERNPRPIVVDDFHFLSKPVQKEVARAIKELIRFNHVIMIAVPYDALAAVRSEPDLGGRVWDLKVVPWELDELAYIAAKGFAALNLTDANGQLAAALASESFGAPFLMQQLCFDLCQVAGVRGPQAPDTQILPPSDWNDFFNRIANRVQPPIFDGIKNGAKTKGQPRLSRRIVGTDHSTDGYGAVLLALKECGPTPVTDLGTLSRAAAKLVEPPQTSQLMSGTLGHMSDIADRGRGTGDAAMVYTGERVHVLDPFLLFYLKWGTWEPPKG